MLLSILPKIPGPAPEPTSRQPTVPDNSTQVEESTPHNPRSYPPPVAPAETSTSNHGEQQTNRSQTDFQQQDIQQTERSRVDPTHPPSTSLQTRTTGNAEDTPFAQSSSFLHPTNIPITPQPMINAQVSSFTLPNSLPETRSHINPTNLLTTPQPVHTTVNGLETPLTLPNLFPSTSSSTHNFIAQFTEAAGAASTHSNHTTFATQSNTGQQSTPSTGPIPLGRKKEDLHNFILYHFPEYQETAKKLYALKMDRGSIQGILLESPNENPVVAIRRILMNECGLDVGEALNLSPLLAFSLNTTN